jgi:hypothetical protein
MPDLRRAVSILLILIALQASAAAVFQALDPRSGGLSSLMGHASRLGGLLVLLALAVCAGLLAARSIRRRDALEESSPWRLVLISGLVLALAAPLLLAGLEALTRAERFAAYARYPTALALPVLVFTLTGLELAAFSALHFRARFAPMLAQHRRLPLILAALGLFTLAVALSRAGVRDLDNLFYGHPGVPVLEWQILLAVCAGLGLAALSARTGPGARLDRWLFVGIWAATALLWLSQPVIPGGYALAPQAPNFEIYPFSDAMSYAGYAQTLLAGAGFNGQVPPRPLYVTLLAGLHAAAGQDYARVITLQTVLLALFPAQLYLLAARLAGRPAALTLALLAALRDLNTNFAAPFATNISFSKLYLSELPTAVLLILCTLFLVRWSRRGLSGWWEPLAAGGLIGLAALIRTQSLIVLPAAFLLLLLGRARGVSSVFSARLSHGMRGLALAVLAAGLVILPWLWRNFQVTGGWVFDDPATQTMVLAQRYGSIYYAKTIAQDPGETTAAYTSRMMSFALENLRRDPRRILSAAVSHWVNNLAGSLRILPLRSAIRAPSDFFNPTWAFWETRLSGFGPGLSILLCFALLVFGLGLSTAFTRLGWAGLLPLVINLSYNLWSALFLTSGERFLLPVDWAFLLYFCGGLFALFAAAFPRLPADPIEAHLPPPPAGARPWAALLLLAAFLLAGASISLAERLVPPRYPAASQAELHALLAEKGPLPANSDGLTLLQGRAVYPLYFPAGGGIAGVEDLGYRPLPQPRLVFRIAGPQSTLAVLDLAAPPDFFPNGADLIALGQTKDGLFAVTAVWIEQNGRGRLWTASP